MWYNILYDLQILQKDSIRYAIRYDKTTLKDYVESILKLIFLYD